MAKCVGVKSRPKELTPKHYDRKNTREKMHEKCTRENVLEKKMHDRNNEPEDSNFLQRPDYKIRHCTCVSKSHV